MPETDHSDGNGEDQALADRLQASYQRILAGRAAIAQGRAEWRAGTLALATDLVVARDRCQDDDRAFGRWLDDHGIDFLSHNDRAALIGMARHPAVTAEVLEKTEKTSWRTIWESEIGPRVRPRPIFPRAGIDTPAPSVAARAAASTAPRVPSPPPTPARPAQTAANPATGQQPRRWEPIDFSDPGYDYDDYRDRLANAASELVDAAHADLIKRFPGSILGRDYDENALVGVMGDALGIALYDIDNTREAVEAANLALDGWGWQLAPSTQRLGPVTAADVLNWLLVRTGSNDMVMWRAPLADALGQLEQLPGGEGEAG